MPQVLPVAHDVVLDAPATAPVVPDFDAKSEIFR
jgi:hypothetical protein